MVKTREKVTEDMLRDRNTWPYETHLCVKSPGKCGIVFRHECGVGGLYVVRNHPAISEKVFGGEFVEEFGTIEALLAAGWVVD